jgi:uncharacterized repeat protein (TIGR03803 family)
MPNNKNLFPRITILIGICFLIAARPASAGSQYKLIHRFSERNGAYPAAGLIFDAAGNLYGTTAFGGNYTGGTVFQLTPGKNGKWSGKVLHSFGARNDGINPRASLIFDASGNLYGTTSNGGRYGGAQYGGTVFELTPNAGSDKWTEKVLHNFGAGRDGANPSASLLFDAAGNLYGTTATGGNFTACNLGCGTVFELVPGADGKWTEKVLHRFDSKDGDGPNASLIFDEAGNIFGTTTYGGAGPCTSEQGAKGCGTVFKLTPGANGDRTETVLCDFSSYNDGEGPSASLIFDAAGNLYGTTEYYGQGSEGTVFELMPQADGSWKETVLYDFDNSNGAIPLANLVFDAAGNLYGTTYYGINSDAGIVFELTRKGGTWTETVLHDFCALRGCTDGYEPQAGVILDTSGNIYGTATQGGLYNYGVVFEIMPGADGSLLRTVPSN